MQKSYERLHIVWLAIAIDKPIDTYTPQNIGRFIDRCFELPKMNISPYNKMTWEQRLDVDVPEEDLQSPKFVEALKYNLAIISNLNTINQYNHGNVR